MFEERIIVSGGQNNNLNCLKSVESYDAVNDDWTLMPDMMTSRHNHNLVAVKNKLFVIGFNSCEVFDSNSDKFVYLKNTFENNFTHNKALSVGSKIFLLQYNTSHVDIYDVINEKWTRKYSEATSNLTDFSFVKLPVH